MLWWVDIMVERVSSTLRGRDRQVSAGKEQTRRVRLVGRQDCSSSSLQQLVVVQNEQKRRRRLAAGSDISCPVLHSQTRAPARTQL